MTLSMTGYATRRGQAAGYAWVWDVRAVNGKGLDLRLRVPDWVEGLEPPLRATLGKAATRGNITLNLKISREAGGETGLRVNKDALHAILTALAEVESVAMETGVTLAQASQADVLGLRGVLEQTGGAEDTAPLLKALMVDVAPLLDDFTANRASEGAALNAVIADQLDQIARLTALAVTEAEARREASATTLRENLARVLANTEGADEARVAQELALMTVKSDVTEELDRLRAHIGAVLADWLSRH